MRRSDAHVSVRFCYRRNKRRLGARNRHGKLKNRFGEFVKTRLLHSFTRSNTRWVWLGKEDELAVRECHARRSVAGALR